MEKTTVNREFEIVKVEKFAGEFTNEEGKTYPYKTYKVHFKALDNPLVFTAKLDKVFNDYIEETYDED